MAVKAHVSDHVAVDDDGGDNANVKRSRQREIWFERQLVLRDGYAFASTRGRSS
jgi:hypothetical protein